MVLGSQCFNLQLDCLTILSTLSIRFCSGTISPSKGCSYTSRDQCESASTDGGINGVGERHTWFALSCTGVGVAIADGIRYN